MFSASRYWREDRDLVAVVHLVLWSDVILVDRDAHRLEAK